MKKSKRSILHLIFFILPLIAAVQANAQATRQAVLDANIRFINQFQGLRFDNHVSLGDVNIFTREFGKDVEVEIDPSIRSDARYEFWHVPGTTQRLGYGTIKLRAPVNLNLRPNLFANIWHESLHYLCNNLDPLPCSEEEAFSYYAEDRVDWLRRHVTVFERGVYNRANLQNLTPAAVDEWIQIRDRWIEVESNDPVAGVQSHGFYTWIDVGANRPGQKGTCGPANKSYNVNLTLLSRLDSKTGISVPDSSQLRTLYADRLDKDKEWQKEIDTALKEADAKKCGDYPTVENFLKPIFALSSNQLGALSRPDAGTKAAQIRSKAKQLEQDYNSSKGLITSAESARAKAASAAAAARTAKEKIEVADKVAADILAIPGGKLPSKDAAEALCRDVQNLTREMNKHIELATKYESETDNYHESTEESKRKVCEEIKAMAEASPDGPTKIMVTEATNIANRASSHVEKARASAKKSRENFDLAKEASNRLNIKLDGMESMLKEIASFKEKLDEIPSVDDAKQELANAESELAKAKTAAGEALDIEGKVLSSDYVKTCIMHTNAIDLISKAHGEAIVAIDEQNKAENSVKSARTALASLSEKLNVINELETLSAEIEEIIQSCTIPEKFPLDGAEASADSAETLAGLAHDNWTKVETCASHIREPRAYIVRVSGKGYIPHFRRGSFIKEGFTDISVKVDPAAGITIESEIERIRGEWSKPPNCARTIIDRLALSEGPPRFWTDGPEVTRRAGPFSAREAEEQPLDEEWKTLEDDGPPFCELLQTFCGVSCVGPDAPSAEGERAEPVNPDALDPDTEPEVAGAIQEWLSIAEPPANAVPGNRYYYDRFGRMMGSGVGMRTVGAHETVDYGTGATPEAKVWSELRTKLDSVDHCTMEEFVVARLEGRSISHCRGRYTSVKPLKGKSLKEAKYEVTKTGLKYEVSTGSAADSVESEDTVERQEPGPDNHLRRGQTLKLVVYGPYVPPMVAVPRVTNMKFDDAVAALEGKGFEIERAEIPNTLSEDKNFTVKTQEPSANKKAEKGSAVKLEVYGRYSYFRDALTALEACNAEKVKEYVAKMPQGGEKAEIEKKYKELTAHLSEIESGKEDARAKFGNDCFAGAIDTLNGLLSSARCPDERETIAGLITEYEDRSRARRDELKAFTGRARQQYEGECFDEALASLGEALGSTRCEESRQKINKLVERVRADKERKAAEVNSMTGQAMAHFEKGCYSEALTVMNKVLGSVRCESSRKRAEELIAKIETRRAALNEKMGRAFEQYKSGCYDDALTAVNNLLDDIQCPSSRKKAEELIAKIETKKAVAANRMDEALQNFEQGCFDDAAAVLNSLREEIKCETLVAKINKLIEKVEGKRAELNRSMREASSRFESGCYDEAESILQGVATEVRCEKYRGKIDGLLSECRERKAALRSDMNNAMNKYEAGDYEGAKNILEGVLSKPLCGPERTEVEGLIARVSPPPTSPPVQESPLMPDLTGMHVDDAADAVRNLGMTPNVRKDKTPSNRNEEHRVYAQNPSANKPVRPGGTVDIYAFSELAPPEQVLREPFYIVFKMYFPDIQVKSEFPEGANYGQYLNGISTSNITYKSDDQAVLIMRVSGDALGVYSRDAFARGKRYSQEVRLTVLDEEMKRALSTDTLVGALLFEVAFVTGSENELKGIYPKAGTAEQPVMQISNSQGTYRYHHQAETGSGAIEGGRLVEGWSEEMKRKNLDLVKVVFNFCFIATAVYQDWDAPELDTLRFYRDSVLARSEAGRRMISAYYKYGPLLALKVYKYERVRPVLRLLFDAGVGVIRDAAEDPDDPYAELAMSIAADLVDNLAVFLDEDEDDFAAAIESEFIFFKWLPADESAER